MPKREPKIYWKASHKAFYCTIKRKQYRLGTDEEQAQTAFHQLMIGKREIGPDTLISELILEFLLWSERKHKPGTHTWYKEHLESFYTHVGKLKVASLKPYHVEKWVEARYPKTDNGSTIGGAMRTVVRVFNWAVKSGRIPKSPLIGLERPAPTHRDVYLMPHEYKQLVAAIKSKQVLELVTVMRESGCRPQEARHVEARHFDRKGRSLIIPKEEAKGGAKGATEARVILLNDKAFEIIQRLALKYPEGKLLRNTRGKAWTRNAFDQQCNKLGKKLGFHVCPYAIRHTFATDAIIRGVDIVTIASLMGHKNLTMLHRIYQHVKRRSDHMRDALKQATEDAA
jgi:integrase